MPLHRIILKTGFITPIPMIYDICGETEQGYNLKINSLYSLQGEECDGFTMPTRVYCCKGIVQSYKNVPLDAVVMKQVEGEEDTIFSLTKLDCKLLGIEYEPHLQLFPIKFDWQPLVRQEIRDYTPRNLGTYKPSPISKKIEQMHIFMGFTHQVNKTHIATPHNSILPLDLFLNSFHIKFKDNNLRGQFPIMIRPLLTGSENSPFFDREKEGINFMLFFAKNNEEKGINPAYFEGKTFDDIFEVSWAEEFTSKEEELIRYINNKVYLKTHKKIKF